MAAQHDNVSSKLAGFTTREIETAVLAWRCLDASVEVKVRWCFFCYFPPLLFPPHARVLFAWMTSLLLPIATLSVAQYSFLLSLMSLPSCFATRKGVVIFLLLSHPPPPKSTFTAMCSFLSSGRVVSPPPPHSFVLPPVVLVSRPASRATDSFRWSLLSWSGGPWGETIKLFNTCSCCLDNITPLPFSQHDLHAPSPPSSSIIQSISRGWYLPAILGILSMKGDP